MIDFGTMASLEERSNPESEWTTMINRNFIVVATGVGSTKISPGSVEVFVPAIEGRSLLETKINPGNVEVSAGGFSTVIGQSKTVAPNSGEHKTSSGASIQMFKGFNLIWEQVP